MFITDPLLLDLPRVIETPRLFLRPPQAGDGEGIYYAIKDGYENLVKWLNWPKTFSCTIDAMEREARMHQARWILREDMRLIVIHKESNTIIGRCGFPPVQLNWQIPYFGISYFLSQSWQGQGYAIEAVNALTRYAFKYMKARKVEIKCDAENLKSIAIPEKIGFIYEARLKGNWPRQDKDELADVLCYYCFDAKNLSPLDVRCLG